jgi:hypothetical protein
MCEGTKSAINAWDDRDLEMGPLASMEIEFYFIVGKLQPKSKMHVLEVCRFASVAQVSSS